MGFREKRIGEAIKVAISEIIQMEFKDPRMPLLVSITSVSVSPDLSNARIYFTQIPDDEEAIAQSLEALESGHGFLRHELAQRIDIRYAPDITFEYDNSIREAEKIEKLLDKGRPQFEQKDEEGVDKD